MWLLPLLAASFSMTPVAADESQPAPDKSVAPSSRVSWDRSRVVGSPEPPLPYKTVRAFPGLEVKSPLTLAPEPGTRREFMIEHLQYWGGPSRLIAFPDDQKTSERKNLVDLDGLAVSLAFHPKYRENGFIYIGMNGPMEGRAKHTQVFRFTVDPKHPDRIDPASKYLIIEWPSNGHDGGAVAFGNDGYLYVSAGDGSSDSDGHLTGQKISDLLASVLRIDVDHADSAQHYSIPRDNPFVDRAGARPELWCYGLRNPWRMSFDGESGQLWVGNNGQDLWEQAYLIKKGANYGWSVAEGGHPFRHQRPPGPDPISGPIADHPHSEARSLSGGMVYRGKTLPELVGAYIYGDWSTGRVWGVKVVDDKVTWHRLLVDTPFSITGFGSDHEGEVYVIDEVSGFHRLTPTTAADRSPTPFPTRLSQTGLFSTTTTMQPDPAAIPYQVIANHWTDGASSEHVAAVPGMDRIEQKSQKNAGGAWTFPNGTVLSQTLSLNLRDDQGKSAPKRVETRLLTRQQGEWIGYSYKWNSDQTDAELVADSGDSEEYSVADPAAPGGRRDQIWRFTSRTECLACHSRAVGFVLGFAPDQLDRDVTRDGGPVNQLAMLERMGIFEGKLPAQGGKPRLVDPYDNAAPVERRARSYLDVNCSTCHVKEGGGNALMELELKQPNNKIHAIDEMPVHSSLGIDNARLIAPGAPERSVLYARINRRGGDQMPPLMSTEIDKQAVEMIGRWIHGLPAAAK